MAFDDLALRFTGTATATTAITTVTTGTKLGIGRYVGAERLFLASLLINGTVVNSSCSLAVKFQDATTETGTYTDMGYAFETWTQTGTLPMGIVVSTTGAVSGTDGPYYCVVRTRANKPWVRVFITPDGTSVQYTPAVVAVPLAEPAF